MRADFLSFKRRAFLPHDLAHLTKKRAGGHIDTFLSKLTSYDLLQLLKRKVHIFMLSNALFTSSEVEAEPVKWEC